MSHALYNKQWETYITLINEQVATRASGGLASIATGVTKTRGRAVWLPDSDRFSEGEAGRVRTDRTIIQVSASEWEKYSFVVGKSLVEMNGVQYRLVNAIDYRHDKFCKAVECELVRKIGFE